PDDFEVDLGASTVLPGSDADGPCAADEPAELRVLGVVAGARGPELLLAEVEEVRVLHDAAPGEVSACRGAELVDPAGIGCEEEQGVPLLTGRATSPGGHADDRLFGRSGLGCGVVGVVGSEDYEAGLVAL